VRILHTADWHVGKKLGRIDRRAECEQALDELVAIAKDQHAGLVVVAGDLLDRALPPLDCVRLVVDVLVRLADAAGAVVAITGNHDSAALFDLLAPLLQPRGVHLVSKIRRPEDGGVVTIRSGDEVAQVAALPFLHEGEFIDFMQDSEEWYKQYADKVRLLTAALCAGIDPAAVGILAAHFFIDGSVPGGGERQIHIGSQYAATHHAIPASIHYAALGHIHRPQAIQGAAAPARYAGSLLQLDFSEREQHKEVVIVDAAPGRPAKVEPVPITSGRQLLRVQGDLDSLKGRAADFGDAYLDVRVETGGPVFGLSDQVREFLPNAVGVQAIYERSATEAFEVRAGRALAEVYAEYHASAHGVAAPPELIETFRALEEELEHAPA
jgi:exonuclease SbcD